MKLSTHEILGSTSNFKYFGLIETPSPQSALLATRLLCFIRQRALTYKRLSTERYKLDEYKCYELLPNAQLSYQWTVRNVDPDMTRRSPSYSTSS